MRVIDLIRDRKLLSPMTISPHRPNSAWEGYADLVSANRHVESGIDLPIAGLMWPDALPLPLD